MRDDDDASLTLNTLLACLLYFTLTNENRKFSVVAILTLGSCVFEIHLFMENIYIGLLRVWLCVLG